LPGGCAGRAGRAFTLLEVMVVMAMLLLLIISALGASSLLDRVSRFQAQDTTALEAAQGRLEELQAIQYNPPGVPFTSTNYYTTNTVVMATAKSGTTNLAVGTMVSLIQPVVAGHLATVTVTYTNYGKPASVRLQTVINKHSGGQP
jgi:prepilin-type N-terminal cleavage/methylation domain-containing protein